jgi:hypothetical protein
MWREVCNFGKVIAKRALKQEVPPSIVVQTRQGMEVAIGWSIVDNQPVEPTNKRRVEQQGLMINASGQIAIYRVVAHPTLMILHNWFKHTPLIDMPPLNSALYFDPAMYPHETSEIHQLTYADQETEPIVGIPAIEHAEMLFETTFL